MVYACYETNRRKEERMETPRTLTTPLPREVAPRGWPAARVDAMRVRSTNEVLAILNPQSTALAEVYPSGLWKPGWLAGPRTVG